MGSYLGFVWMYLQPLLFIVVLYSIFNIGLKTAASVNGVPFSVFLITGMVPWFYIAGNFSSMSNVVSQYSFLLKKVEFRISMLPVVKLMSSFTPHLFFISVIFIVALLNDVYPTIYALQLLYYYFSMCVLLLGLGWLTSATKVFIPDVSNIVKLVVSFGFWLTPIFWNVDKIPQQYQWVITLNPAAYIVQGYRDSIIFDTWFWERPNEMLYFWSITVVVTVIGASVFKRLRPHLAEVV